LEIETRGVPANVVEALRGISGVTQVDVAEGRIRIIGSLEDDAVAEANRRLIASGVAILSSRRIEPNLEEAFLALTRGQA